MKKQAIMASEVNSSSYSTSVDTPVTVPARCWMEQQTKRNSHKVVPAIMPVTDQQYYGKGKSHCTSKLYIVHEAGKYMRAFGADTTKLNV